MTAGTVPHWDESRAAAGASGLDACVGLLGDQIASHGECVQAVGPGAALGAARASGMVARYQRYHESTLPSALAPPPLTLIDVGPIRDPADINPKDETRPTTSRAQQVAVVGARVGAVLKVAPAGADAVVASPRRRRRHRTLGNDCHSRAPLRRRATGAGLDPNPWAGSAHGSDPDRSSAPWHPAALEAGRHATAVRPRTGGLRSLRRPASAHPARLRPGLAQRPQPRRAVLLRVGPAAAGAVSVRRVALEARVGHGWATSATPARHSPSGRHCRDRPGVDVPGQPSAVVALLCSGGQRCRLRWALRGSNLGAGSPGTVALPAVRAAGRGLHHHHGGPDAGGDDRVATAAVFTDEPAAGGWG